jgi:ABC-2 type transport system ATP-binding protein
MIEIKNVTKKYGNKKAVDDVSFNVNDGDIFSFIGHNGAGKTTLIKSIVGIHDFDEGDILIDGKSIKEDPVACKKLMAFVPDNPETYEHMKAIDYINFICDMYEVDDDVREKNIKKYAKLFAMEDKLNDTIESYSHGMKQKIVLISALSHDPRILIMDEPSSALDPIAEYELNKAMESAAKGKTVFYISHRLSTTRDADRIIMLERGRIIEEGTHTQLLARNGKYAEMWNAQAGKYN